MFKIIKRKGANTLGHCLCRGDQLLIITLPLRGKWLHAVLEIKVGSSVCQEYLSTCN